MKRLAATVALALSTAACSTTVSAPTSLAPLETNGVPKTTDAPIATPAPEVTISESTRNALFINNIEGTIGTPVYDEAGAIETGYMICDVLRTGSGTLEDVMDIVLANSTTDSDLLLLTAVTASALTNLCPDMSYMIDELP